MSRSTLKKNSLRLEIKKRRGRLTIKGKFIAEAKFSDPKHNQLYIELIKKRDSKAIYDLLTDTNVEEKLLKRLKNKATVYGQEVDPLDLKLEETKLQKIDVDLVVKLYKDYVIPLTKEVEVDYLLNRLLPMEGDSHVHGLMADQP